MRNSAGTNQNAYIDGNAGEIAYSGRTLGGSLTLAVASAAPYGCSNGVVGAHIYINDGRKPGETVGNGSGVPADCTLTAKGNPAVWVSVYDHSQVVN